PDLLDPPYQSPQRAATTPKSHHHSRRHYHHLHASPPLRQPPLHHHGSRCTTTFTPSPSHNHHLAAITIEHHHEAHKGVWIGVQPQGALGFSRHHEGAVLAKERVKISTTNVRLKTIIQQKEKTFQVIIDVIKNSTSYKAFTISSEVPETFMQQFWYIVKKVKDTEYYDFLLANKKCKVDVEVFWKILDICPRVQGVEFAKVPDDEATLTFILILGYKGLLNKHLSMHVDHMHQPRRTLAFIINKCLFGKSASNDRIGEDFQEYGLPILETMLTEAIKQSESYQMFIKYSTGQISPKKSIGKGSQGKKTVDTTEETVDVCKESHPEPVRKQTANGRVVKKKVTITVDDSIILEQDIALELGKSMSLTEATEEDASSIPGELDESIVITATSSEGTGTKVTSEDKVILEWGSKQESDYTKEEDDDEIIKWVDTDEKKEKKEHVQDDDEETDDEFIHSDEQVNDDEDEEMINDEVEESRNDDEEIIDATKDTTDVEINSLLDIKIQSEVPHIQVAKLENYVSELKKINHFVEALATLKSQVPMVVEHYLGSKISDDLQKVLQRHTADLIQKYSMKPTPEPSKIQTPIINLEPESKKSALEIRKAKKEQAEKQKMPKHHDDEDPSAGPNHGKKTKRRSTKESESSKKPSTTKKTSKVKALTKSSKTDKSANAQEPITEPIAKVVMDDLETTANEYVVNDVDRPQDYVAPKTNNPSRDTWFKQPP
nr:hypothetical protein [Tanacetum cinerariifolium]